MVQFNTKDNEILVKIVYYGPGLSGKTTNLQKLHDMMDSGQRTDLFSVNTMEDRTLFFDLLPFDLGMVHGNSIKLQIYTVPGQVHYDSTRRIVLSGADGVIFVADSDKTKLHENVQSINNLYHNLQANRLNIKEVPLVMQYNKRDLESALSVDALNQKLNFRHVPHFEAVAVHGQGVLETFLEGVKQSVKYIFTKYQLSKSSKNVDGILQKLEESVLSKADYHRAQAAPVPAEKKAKSPRGGKTVLKYTHTIDDDDRSSQDQLLQKALNSNMETARLYSDLKNSQQALVKKNEELAKLYKQLEKSNRDNLKIRRFMESMVNFAGEAIITFSEQWVIQNWNQAAEDTFRYRKDEVLGKNVNILFPKESLTDLNRVLQFVVSGKVVKGFETRLVAKDGGLIPVNMTLSPIKTQENKISAFAGIIRDLTFMAKINGRLYDLQRFEVLGGVVPDLMGEVLTLLNSAKLTGEEGLQVKALQRSVHLLKQLSAVHSGEAEPANINDLINDAHAIIAPRLAKDGIGWSAQLNPGVPTLLMEKPRIMQVLLNFLLNAVESIGGKNNGKITLGTHATEKEVLLQIIDNGNGFAMDEFDTAFDPDAEDRNSQQDLRYNAARQFLKENGGALRVDSAPGKGSKVTIRFIRG